MQGLNMGPLAKKFALCSQALLRILRAIQLIMGSYWYAPT